MPPKEIRELRIDLERLVPKLAAKGITIQEVREAVQNAKTVHKGPRNNDPNQDGRCYFVEAPTDAGRILKILLRRFDGGAARVITAWEP